MMLTQPLCFRKRLHSGIIDALASIMLTAQGDAYAQATLDLRISYAHIVRKLMPCCISDACISDALLSTDACV